MNNKDIVKLFNRRATRVVKLLTESGLWSNVKNNFENYLTLGYAKCLEMSSKTHEVFEDFNHYEFLNICSEKSPFKKMEFRPYSGVYLDPNWNKNKIAEVIKGNKEFSTLKRRVKNGYEASFEFAVDEENVKRAWYSEEYVGCANGYYYIALNSEIALFQEKD